VTTTPAGTLAGRRLDTLPGDDVRQVLWGYADRFDLQMLIQSARAVARGPVARLVAAGGRNTHEWTEEKAALLGEFDRAGITAVYIDPEHGGYLQGPKNLAMALTAFELAWVDGGAATSSMAGHLALAPIREKGTPEQQATYMSRSLPARQGEQHQPWRGAFCLTEPLPFVGVDTGMLSGRARVLEWPEDGEPILHVEKRGRFITNMAFADFVTAAVDSGDDRIKGSCMIILERNDPGTFDRGSAARKLVHQLSSTMDPIFRLDVPASRIVGGYRVVDGKIVPNFSHGQVIEAVFRRTRVTVGLMTAAKLLSAVEPIIRYQRTRFRGGVADVPGSPRHDLGLQQKQDVLHRLVDVWATGEASASLGFATARFLDGFDPLERRREEILAERGIPEGRARARALEKLERPTLELIEQTGRPEALRDAGRFLELASDEVLQLLAQDAVAGVLCPACKLWNTGHGANMMREAVSLMGGYGITEDCPGFLGQKWMDAQLEATYEGPEAVQRRHLSVTMTQEIFLGQFRQWITEMRRIAGRRPGTGACTLASAMELWLWTIRHLLRSTDADGKALYRDHRQGITFPMADALCWLLASFFQIRDVLRLEEEGSASPNLAESLPGFVWFLTHLAHVQAARAAGEVARICTEQVFGYNRHPSWDAGLARGYDAEDLDRLEAILPGLAACARSVSDVTEADGSHPDKAGPCVNLEGMEPFLRLRRKLDGCGTGAGLAKDQAAGALTEVMIPEALDYPV
jgi:alkylation response protein AidB-like acyl-CoA dehydrogenase